LTICNVAYIKVLTYYTPTALVLQLFLKGVLQAKSLQQQVTLDIFAWTFIQNATFFQNRLANLSKLCYSVCTNFDGAKNCKNHAIKVPSQTLYLYNKEEFL